MHGISRHASATYIPLNDASVNQSTALLTCNPVCSCYDCIRAKNSYPI